jgi:radical SAM protein with 4Fe4S-binding SPASM domain
LFVERNSHVDIAKIAENTGIAEESIEEFFEELLNLGLLVNEIFDSRQIIEYRKRIGFAKKDKSVKTERTTQEKLPYEMSSAENAYTHRAGGITSVMFELTYNCSEQCIHCYNSGATRNDTEQSKRNRQELTFEDYKQIIDELYSLGLMKVCLSGGDPFSNPFVWQIIDYLYKKEIATDIFTNGQKLIGKVERLIACYPRSVGISIYSGVAEDHDYITRTKGSFQKSLKVAREFADYGVPMNIKCCVVRTNVKTYYTVAELAKELGAIPQIEICITDSVDGDRCASENLRLTNEMLTVVLRDDNIPLYVGKEAPNFGGQAKLMNTNACGAGKNSFCITPEGNVQPCTAFPCSFGNLKSQTVTDIFQNSKDLKWWQNLTLNDYKECGKQDYCDYCNLCAGNNYIEHGTPLKAAELNCYIAKNRYELAIKMKNGYDPLQGKTLQQRLSELQTKIRPLQQVFAPSCSNNRGKRINEVSETTSITT